MKSEKLAKLEEVKKWLEKIENGDLGKQLSNPVPVGDCMIKTLIMPLTIFTVTYITIVDKTDGSLLVAGTGIAKKSPLDKYDPAMGRYISIGRAKKVLSIKLNSLLEPKVKEEYRCNFAG